MYRESATFNNNSYTIDMSKATLIIVSMAAGLIQGNPEMTIVVTLNTSLSVSTALK